jgi:ferredoxin-NADP reductase
LTHDSLLQAYSHLVLLAGGTGVTPMFQIASSILHNPANKTHVTMLSFSTGDQDICLYQDLVSLQGLGATFFTLKFFASALSAANARQDVNQGSMRLFTSQQLLEHAGVPVSEATMFCISGPRDWIIATQSLLKEGGVLDSRILAWS